MQLGFALPLRFSHDVSFDEKKEVLRNNLRMVQKISMQNFPCDMFSFKDEAWGGGVQFEKPKSLKQDKRKETTQIIEYIDHSLKSRGKKNRIKNMKNG